MIRDRPEGYDVRMADPVSLSALVVSVATLSWTAYHGVKAREISRKSDIEIEKDGRKIVIEVKDLNEPEQAELFVKDILSRQGGDGAEAK
jgi:hypothetical protein